MNQKYSGVNIQWPISRLIVEGKKAIETRHYPLPKKHENCELLLIETPGPNGDFKSRIVGTIIFSGSIQYKSEAEFYRDTKKHLVEKTSPWRWVQGKTKWGWLIKNVSLFDEPIAAPPVKGIRFTNNIILPPQHL
jgi:hypothetical protein